MERLEELLERFSELAEPGPFDYEWCHHYDGGEGMHVVIGSIIHGNEVGSLPAVVSLLEGLVDGSTTFAGQLTLFLGNPEASRADQRFLETDLNRAFVSEPPDSHEGRRASELKPILDEADVFLDVHQTIETTDRPFYIFPFDTESWNWARAIAGASTWVTRPSTESFSSGTCCADEFVRLRGKVGLTLELGTKGFHQESVDRAATAIAGLLATASDPSNSLNFSSDADDLEFIQTAWSQKFDDPDMRLRPGLTNFQAVTAGELLSAASSPVIEAPFDGLLLFPKYPPLNEDGTIAGPRPNEIVRIVQMMDAHPADIWG